MSKSIDGRSGEIEFDGSNLFTGQVAIGIKRAGALLDGSITEQEKLNSSAKIPQSRRARKKVAILLFSGGLARSSVEVFVMETERRG